MVSLNGKVLEKPTTVDAARDRLFELRGKTHELHSAVALAEEGSITWTHIETAQLTMRAFSPQFVGRYLAAIGPQVFMTVSRPLATSRPVDRLGLARPTYTGHQRLRAAAKRRSFVEANETAMRIDSEGVWSVDLEQKKSGKTV